MEGFRILINYKSNEAEAQKTLALIRENGGDGELLPFDVSKKEAVEKVLATWIESNKDKTIEVLVNNAGINNDNLMVFMSDDQWSSVLDSSLNGFFYVTKLV